MNKGKKKPEKAKMGTAKAAVGPQFEAVAQKAAGVVEPVLAAEGLELVLAQFCPEPGGPVLRLFVDRPGGVTLEDCMAASRLVSDLLDVYMEDQAGYRLEVSSPGDTRPLTKKEHFEKFRGSRAKVTLAQPQNGRKNFTGRIAGVENSTLTLACDGGIVELALDGIAVARLCRSKGEDRC
ncbi:MAG: ribosome maturation factor RimP [Desulfatibacillaceae bacterium]|nr:ribosome maturation factor RimP [Desulfatibacillaceae bacterium]